MKFYNICFTDAFYISAYGKGKDVGIRIQKPDVHNGESMNTYLELDEAKKFVHSLQKAIEMAEKRVNLSEDEEG